jgi:hypothetical protein
MVSSFVRLSDAALGSGNYGIDLFFVLSAYLITESLVRENARRGSLDVKAPRLKPRVPRNHGEQSGASKLGSPTTVDEGG